MEKLGQILLKEKLITEEQLAKAIQTQRRSGQRLGSCLVEMGFVESDRISEIVARQLKARPILEADIKIDPEAVKRVPADVALDYELVPMRVDGEMIEVVIAEPHNFFGLDELKWRTGFKRVVLFVASEIVIHRMIAKHYRQIRPRRHPMQGEQAAIA